MTRRERLERKLEKRREWAESRKGKAEASWEGSRQATEGIPLGQPILVGHHSEKRHRAAVDRAANRANKALEHEEMASKHSQAAAGLEGQLSGSIFSDDPDAIEALEEKARALEERRDAMKRLSAAWRKAKKPAADDAQGWAKVAELLGCDIGNLTAARQNMVLCWSNKPVSPYSMTNLGGRIRAARKRIDDIKAQTAQTEKAEAAGGTLVEDCGHGYARVTFEDYPGRETIAALKAAGFHWSRPSWYGNAADLPEGI